MIDLPKTSFKSATSNKCKVLSNVPFSGNILEKMVYLNLQRNLHEMDYLLLFCQISDSVKELKLNWSFLWSNLCWMVKVWSYWSYCFFNGIQYHQRWHLSGYPVRVGSWGNISKFQLLVIGNVQFPCYICMAYHMAWFAPYTWLYYLQLNRGGYPQHTNVNLYISPHRLGK